MIITRITSIAPPFVFVLREAQAQLLPDKSVYVVQSHRAIETAESLEIATRFTATMNSLTTSIKTPFSDIEVSI